MKLKEVPANRLVEQDDLESLRAGEVGHAAVGSRSGALLLC